MSFINKIIAFLQTDIWRIRVKQVKGPRSLLITQLRIILLAIRGFDEDKCTLRASALTFFSLLSIVPIVAMAFGIAKGFGIKNRLEAQLRERLPGQEEVVNRIIEFSQALLANTQGGIIAGVGVAILFWSVVKVLGNIEESFNGIWGVQKGRPWGRKLTDYLSIMLICPVLLIMASSLTVIITSKITLVVHQLSFLGPVGDFILWLLTFLPYCVMWFLFTFLYTFIPNTSVKLKSALLGGIIAGTIYQAVQWGYIAFQVGVSRYGAIYGSFAALPLFLVWMQISWLIVLFGAEISFAEQNVHTYEFEPDSLRTSRRFRQLVAVTVTALVVKRFDKAEPPLTAEEIASALELPIRLANQVLFNLTECGVLTEVKRDIGVVAFQPAYDIDDMTLQHVLERMDDFGSNNIPLADNELIGKIRYAMENLNVQIAKSGDNVLLKDL